MYAEPSHVYVRNVSLCFLACSRVLIYWMQLRINYCYCFFLLVSFWCVVYTIYRPEYLHFSLPSVVNHCNDGLYSCKCAVKSAECRIGSGGVAVVIELLAWHMTNLQRKCTALQLCSFFLLGSWKFIHHSLRKCCVYFSIDGTHSSHNDTANAPLRSWPNFTPLMATTTTVAVLTTIATTPFT